MCMPIKYFKHSHKDSAAGAVAHTDTSQHTHTHIGPYFQRHKDEKHQVKNQL